MALELDIPRIERVSEDNGHHDDYSGHNNNGEAPDHSGMRILQLTHKALSMVPEFARKHRKFIGTLEVIGSAAIVATSVVVTRRLIAAGPDAPDEKVLDGITKEELEAKHPKPEKPANGNNSRLSH